MRILNNQSMLIKPSNQKCGLALLIHSFLLQGCNTLDKQFFFYPQRVVLNSGTWGERRVQESKLSCDNAQRRAVSLHLPNPAYTFDAKVSSNPPDSEELRAS